MRQHLFEHSSKCHVECHEYLCISLFGFDCIFFAKSMWPRPFFIGAMRSDVSNWTF